VSDEPVHGLSLADAAGQVSQLLAVGQSRRARELATGLVARAPDDPAAHHVLGLVLVSLHELEAAQAAADETVRLAPDIDSGHSLRGQVLLLRGRFAEAERAVREALSLDPAESHTHLLRARLLLACERYFPAQEAVEAALRLDPDVAEAHQLRAILLLKLQPGRWQISEDTARRAVELDPDDADGHAVLGMVYLKSQRQHEAEERFRAALTIDPTNSLALHGLAEALMAQSPLYRPFLRFSLLLERSGTGVQLAVIAGLWALVNAAVPLLRSGAPPLPALAGPLQVAYLAFCAYTWFATPVVRFVLGRRYPWLREIGD
jgi:tetratricopeptide (TPR) repeat protein